MRKIIILLASALYATFPIAGEASPDALPDESACFDNRAAFADCIYAIKEIKTVVSTERSIDGTNSTGLLNIGYIVAEFGALQDGMDPNVSVFLKFEYFVDGIIVKNTHVKVGSFLNFNSFERQSPGKYIFSGEVFSDDGCVVNTSYEVDATDYTIALREPESNPLPELQINQGLGTCN